jgi:hypothetical protein
MRIIATIGSSLLIFAAIAAPGGGRAVAQTKPSAFNIATHRGPDRELITVRAMSLLLLLVGPNSQIVAVSRFDMWNNGPIGELAALGCVWTAIMTGFSVAFLVLARRYQLPLG